MDRFELAAVNLRLFSPPMDLGTDTVVLVLRPCRRSRQPRQDRGRVFFRGGQHHFDRHARLQLGIPQFSPLRQIGRPGQIARQHVGPAHLLHGPVKSFGQGGLDEPFLCPGPQSPGNDFKKPCPLQRMHRPKNLLHHRKFCHRAPLFGQLPQLPPHGLERPPCRTGAAGEKLPHGPGRILMPCIRLPPHLGIQLHFLQHPPSDQRDSRLQRNTLSGKHPDGDFQRGRREGCKKFRQFFGLGPGPKGGGNILQRLHEGSELRFRNGSGIPRGAFLSPYRGPQGKRQLRVPRDRPGIPSLFP